MMQEILNSEIFNWVGLPILIFFCRILDQSCGTMRIIFATKGLKNLTPLFAFFESFIWILATSQIMKHLDNSLCYLAYAAGYATGNYVGLLLDEKLSIGNVIIRIMPKDGSTELVNFLRNNNFGVSVVDVEGKLGAGKMIFSVVNRKDINEVIKAIDVHNPNAFYSIEEVRTVKEGYFKNNYKQTVLSIFSSIFKRNK